MKGNFEIEWMRVPVQYRSWSRERRKVLILGEFGSILKEGRFIGYYQIVKDEKGGGRFFRIERWKDNDGKIWEIAYSMKKYQLPQILQNAKETIEGGLEDLEMAKLERKEEI